MKLVVREQGSAAARRLVVGADRVLTCGLARTEVPRAIARTGLDDWRERARRALAVCDVLELDQALLDRAGQLEPRSTRTLDAIHLAAAERVADAIDAIVTYDDRQATAARALVLDVITPLR